MLIAKERFESFLFLLFESDESFEILELCPYLTGLKFLLIVEFLKNSRGGVITRVFGVSTPGGSFAEPDCFLLVTRITFVPWVSIFW